jgi:endogenous inhibitor of DNA gyrase (YacG/DUF329 family)
MGHRPPGKAITELKSRTNVRVTTGVEPHASHADLFCPGCQTVSRHAFLNPDDPTRVKCSRCGAARDLNRWEPEESEISLAGYATGEDEQG